MRRLELFLLVSFLLTTLAFVQKENILAVRASPDVYQGNLVLTGNNVTVIEGIFDINGSIMVEENATLILRNAILSFTQVQNFQFNMTFFNPASGNPRLLLENATIEPNGYRLNLYLNGNSSATINRLSTPFALVNLYFSDSSSASILASIIGGYLGTMNACSVTVSDSFVTDSSINQNSSAAFSNCTLSTLQADGNSEATATHCTINTFVSASTWSANYSVFELEPGSFNYWNFEQNCSVALAPDGWAPNLTLMDTQVEGWGFYSEGKSNATISNSELYVLWAQNSADSSIYDSAIATNLWGYDSSHWSLYNTTIAGLRSYQDSRFWLINSTSNAYTIGGQSKVTIGWYLRIHVIDSIGQDIPSANVTATYPNATVAESELADANGWTKLTLMEKMMNTDGSYSVGNYDINATYLSYSSDAAANMTGNQAITLILQGFVIPEFPSFLIVPLFICATLFAAIAYRKKREKLN